jgi:hypothetical protein
LLNYPSNLRQKRYVKGKLSERCVDNKGTSILRIFDSKIIYWIQNWGRKILCWTYLYCQSLYSWSCILLIICYILIKYLMIGKFDEHKTGKMMNLWWTFRIWLINVFLPKIFTFWWKEFLYP